MSEENKMTNQNPEEVKEDLKAEAKKLQEDEPKAESGEESKEEWTDLLQEDPEEEAAYQARRKARKEAALKRQKKAGICSEIVGWVIPIAIAVALTLLLKTFVIINARVPSGSMETTIMTGDNLMGYRLAYSNKDPERGDIIIFYYPDDESQKFIKRIIGLPGENVLIEDGKIYIDGSDEPLEEDYINGEWTVGTGPYEFQVPEDSYLVLGDNRNNSRDARYWANSYVSREKIIAKAMFIYWPFNHWESLNDK